MQAELKLRIVSGIVMAAVVLVATWMGGGVFRLLSAAIALLVYYEWASMTGLSARAGWNRIVGWMLMVVIALGVLFDQTAIALGLVALAILGGLGDAVAGWRRTDGWEVGGIVYAGLTGISLAAIRGADHTGLVAMLFVFAVVWGTDILAYFVGRAIGGPKLAPKISPGKTWSGAVGGAVSAVVAGTAVFAAFFPLSGLWVPFLALLLSASSQIGDLFESWIKRRFGAKDSSRLIPGHGGVMDRVDGLVFACIAALLLTVAHSAITTGDGRSTATLLLGL